MAIGQKQARRDGRPWPAVRSSPELSETAPETTICCGIWTGRNRGTMRAHRSVLRQLKRSATERSGRHGWHEEERWKANRGGDAPERRGDELQPRRLAFAGADGTAVAVARRQSR